MKLVFSINYEYRRLDLVSLQNKLIASWKRGEKDRNSVGFVWRGKVELNWDLAAGSFPISKDSYLFNKVKEILPGYTSHMTRRWFKGEKIYQWWKVDKSHPNIK